MMATSLTWIYACRLGKAPSQRHAVKDRNHFAFSNVRRLVTPAAPVITGTARSLRLQFGDT